MEAELRAALEALCRVPSGNGGPDPLVLGFDESYTAFISGADRLPSEQELLALQALDAELQSMMGPNHAELWTEAAWKQHSRWDRVRELAQAALVACGWATTH